MEKWIAAVVVVVIVIAAAVWYKAGSAPAAVETAETTSDTGEKYEVSPGVYNDGTVRKPSTEEWETYTDEEKAIWREANSKQLGFQSYGDIHQVSEEETQEAIDSFNPDNPYIQDIINSGVLDN